MHGAAVNRRKFSILRQFIDKSCREQKHATGNTLAGF